MTIRPDIFVRPAADSDGSTLEDHLSQSIVESSQYRGSGVLQQERGSFEFTLVAGVGESVFASLEASGELSGSINILHVFVQQEAREIGLGDALVLAALDHIKNSGGKHVLASALPGDRAMKNLFERHGLVAQTIVVGKNL